MRRHRLLCQIIMGLRKHFLFVTGDTGEKEEKEPTDQKCLSLHPRTLSTTCVTFLQACKWEGRVGAFFVLFFLFSFFVFRGRSVSTPNANVLCALLPFLLSKTRK